MRGVRPRAAGPFSDARKGTKSAFKGRRPLKNPAPPDDGGGCTAVQYLTFLKEDAAFRRQGMRGVRPRAAGPFSDARKGTKSAFKGRRPLKNPAPPDDGGGCTAVQYLTFLKEDAAFRRQGMRGVRPRAAGPFSDARKGTKSAFKGRRPLKNPAPPDKRSCSGLTCTLGCPQAFARCFTSRDRSSTDVEAFCF